MRLFLLSTITGALLISGCYNQPVISPLRPLTCNPAEEKGQCPKGFGCTVIGVCAADSCAKNLDCAAGLICSSRGCVVPGDAGVDAQPQIPAIPDGGFREGQIDGGTPLDVAGPSDIATSIPDGGQG